MKRDTTIQVHHGFPGDLSPPVWSGSLAEFLQQNDALSVEDVRDLLADLTGCGRHLLGGGAGEEITVSVVE